MGTGKTNRSVRDEGGGAPPKKSLSFFHAAVGCAAIPDRSADVRVRTQWLRRLPSADEGSATWGGGEPWSSTRILRRDILPDIIYMDALRASEIMAIPSQ